MNRIRFWTFHNGAPVRLTLIPGLRERIEIEDGGPHEEGWWASRTEYALEGKGDAMVLVQRVSHEGRDCDGRHSSEYQAACALDCLQGHLFEGVPWPEWQPESASQRDYTAEAAGY